MAMPCRHHPSHQTSPVRRSPHVHESMIRRSSRRTSPSRAAASSSARLVTGKQTPTERYSPRAETERLRRRLQLRSPRRTAAGAAPRPRRSPVGNVRRRARGHGQSKTTTMNKPCGRVPYSLQAAHTGVQSPAGRQIFHAGRVLHDEPSFNVRLFALSGAGACMCMEDLSLRLLSARPASLRHTHSHLSPW
jgi:hypothetical protein